MGNQVRLVCQGRLPTQTVPLSGCLAPWLRTPDLSQLRTCLAGAYVCMDVDKDTVVFWVKHVVVYISYHKQYSNEIYKESCVLPVEGKARPGSAPNLQPQQDRRAGITVVLLSELLGLPVRIV